MELKTTEEFIREAHGAACSTWKQRIEKEFPELFKKELKAGKWYKFKFDTGLELTSMITEIQADRIDWFGFRNNIWRDSDWSELNSINRMSLFAEATTEEVKSALEKEIIKRFGEDWKNAKIEAHADGEPWIGNGLNKGLFDSGIGKSKVFSKHGVLYSNGVFAEPLKEKTIITHEKALKIIAKKLKVSPESIEIK